MSQRIPNYTTFVKTIKKSNQLQPGSENCPSLRNLYHFRTLSSLEPAKSRGSTCATLCYPRALSKTSTLKHKSANQKLSAAESSKWDTWYSSNNGELKRRALPYRHTLVQEARYFSSWTNIRFNEFELGSIDSSGISSPQCSTSLQVQTQPFDLFVQCSEFTLSQQDLSEKRC